jgi:tripartite-type tricarboxylate transporter receptor subunit TctC
LTPLALVAWSAMALAVGPAVPATVRTLADFLDWARAHPQLASYASPASGSIPHLLMAALAQAQNLPLTHVAYRGSTQALQDLRGGVLPALSGPLGVMLPHLRDGGLRLLAVSGERRSSFAPQVPTYREQGHDLTAREWYGWFAPGKARPEVVQRASAALRAAMAPPEMHLALVQLGLEPASAGPEELAALMRADAQSWRKLITRLGFTAES